MPQDADLMTESHVLHWRAVSVLSNEKTVALNASAPRNGSCLGVNEDTQLLVLARMLPSASGARIWCHRTGRAGAARLEIDYALLPPAYPAAVSAWSRSC